MYYFFYSSSDLLFSLSGYLSILTCFSFVFSKKLLNVMQFKQKSPIYLYFYVYTDISDSFLMSFYNLIYIL